MERTLCRGKMTELSLGLSPECNLRCVHCIGGDVATDCGGIAPEELLAYLDSRPDVGRVIFTIGEPTLDPRFPELARSLAARGLWVAMITNGTAISDPRYLARLMENGLKSVELTLNSYIERIDDEISGVRGTYRKRLRALESCETVGQWFPLDLKANIVVNALTYRHVRRTIEFLNNRAPLLRTFHLRYIVPFGRAHGKRELVPRYSAAEPFLHRAFELAGKEKFTLFVSSMPLCFFGDYPEYYEFMENEEFHREESSFIFERLYPKTKQHIGEIFFIKPEPCGRCAASGRCNGIIGLYADMHGYYELKPFAW
jgi:MoaA/NifB/PqqE/SkfB family radical SAM enzyme